MLLFLPCSAGRDHNGFTPVRNACSSMCYFISADDAFAPCDDRGRTFGRLAAVPAAAAAAAGTLREVCQLKADSVMRVGQQNAAGGFPASRPSRESRCGGNGRMKEKENASVDVRISFVSSSLSTCLSVETPRATFNESVSSRQQASWKKTNRWHKDQRKQVRFTRTNVLTT